MGAFLLRAAHRSRPQVFALLHSDWCRVGKPPWTGVEGEVLAGPPATQLSRGSGQVPACAEAADLQTERSL